MDPPEDEAELLLTLRSLLPMEELGEVEVGEDGDGDNCDCDDRLGGELRLFRLIGGEAMLGGCSRCGCTE